MQGAGNRMYESGYHYFERRRLAAGKAKNASRLASEAAFPNGHDLVTRNRVWCFMGEVPVIDRLGRLKMMHR